MSYSVYKLCTARVNKNQIIQSVPFLKWLLNINQIFSILNLLPKYKKNQANTRNFHGKLEMTGSVMDPVSKFMQCKIYIKTHCRNIFTSGYTVLKKEDDKCVHCCKANLVMMLIFFGRNTTFPRNVSSGETILQ